MSQMNFPSEDLLWKLGISTLFIFTHRLLIRNTAQKSPKKDKGDGKKLLTNSSTTASEVAGVVASGGSGSTTKASEQTGNDDHDLSSIRADRVKQDHDTLSDISTSDLYRSPADGATSMHINTAHRVFKSPPVTSSVVHSPVNTSTTTKTPYKTNNTNNGHHPVGGDADDAKIRFEDVMSQNISHHDDEYIHDTFKQTMRLFYEENRSLKKKVEDLQFQMSASMSSSSASLFSPVTSSQHLLHSSSSPSSFMVGNGTSSIMSATTTPYKTRGNSFSTAAANAGIGSPSIQYLIEQNQKLSQDKQLLIQSIEFAHNQFQKISQRHLNQLSSDEEEGERDADVILEEEDVQVIAKGMANHLQSQQPSIAPPAVTTEKDQLKELDDHIYLRLKQILQDIPLTDLVSTTSPSNGFYYGPDQTSFSSPILPTRLTATSGSPTASSSSASPVVGVSSSEILLQKLNKIQQILTVEYPSLKASYDTLSTSHQDALQQINDLKNQLSQYKLLKVQEITDLHRKIVELSHFYEQQIQQIKESQAATTNNTETANNVNGDANTNKNGSGSRSTTPSSVTKKKRPSHGGVSNNNNNATTTTTTTTPVPTPNTQFISLPHSIGNIGKTSENSAYITKELAKSFQSPSLPYSEDVDNGSTPVVNSLQGRDVTPGKIRKTSTTPSKVRKGTTSPSIASYQRQKAMTPSSASKVDLSSASHDSVGAGSNSSNVSSLNTTTDSVFNSPSVSEQVKKWEKITKK